MKSILAILLSSLLSLASLSTSSLMAQRDKGCFLKDKEFPSVEVVIAKTTGKDKFDSYARQIAALRIMEDVNSAFVPQNGKDCSWLTRFGLAASELETTSLRQMNGDMKVRDDWSALCDEYYDDASFRTEVLNKFVSRKTHDEFLKLEEKRIEKEANAVAAEERTEELRERRGRARWILRLMVAGIICLVFLIPIIMIYLSPGVTVPGGVVGNDGAEALPEGLGIIRLFKRTIPVVISTGTVYDKDTVINTTVTTTTTGGSGYGTNAGGSYSPPSTSTHVHQSTSFRYWLRAKNGSEYSRTFHESAFQASKDQLVSTIETKDKVILVFNHGTKHFRVFYDQLVSYRINLIMWVTVFIWWGICFGGYKYVDSLKMGWYGDTLLIYYALWSFGGATALAIYGFVLKRMIQGSRKNKFDRAHLPGILDFLQKKV